MKKQIYITVAAALLAGMTLSSCSDFLEAENKSAGGLTADDRLGSDATPFLTAAYNSMKSIVFNPALLQQGTDLYIHTRSKTTSVFSEYSLASDDGTVESFYSNVYKTINYANGVINYAGGDSQLGYEARFLRNYGYYMLTQLFGGVPYVTTYINDANRDYPRTALSDVYKGMIEDLTDLYNNSSLADQDHTGRASKQAVAALLAKVYLAAGWDIDTKYNSIEAGTYTVNSTDNFNKAAQWAETAIHNVSLTMSFEDKWSPANEGNAEEIFSVQYKRDGYPGDVLTSGHSMQNDFGGYYGECNSSGQKNCSSENAQSEKAMYLFEQGDLRYEATFMTTMYNAEAVDPDASTITAKWGDEGYYAYYNVSAEERAKNTPIAHRYFPWYVTEAEAEAEFVAHQSQYVRGNNITEVSAVILSLPNVVKYTFKADGTVNQKVKEPINSYNGLVNNGVCVKKFDDPESSQITKSNDYRDIVLLHVSEMYLVAAEAYLMAGQNAQALDKLNAVRKRAGLPALASMADYQPEYSTSGGFNIRDIDFVLDERARETYAEGYRWMDLRRTKQLVRYNVEFNQYVPNADAMKGTGTNEFKLYKPIPTDELELNTAMTADDQNPGY